MLEKALLFGGKAPHQLDILSLDLQIDECVNYIETGGMPEAPAEFGCVSVDCSRTGRPEFRYREAAPVKLPRLRHPLLSHVLLPLHRFSSEETRSARDLSTCASSGIYQLPGF